MKTNVVINKSIYEIYQKNKMDRIKTYIEDIIYNMYNIKGEVKIVNDNEYYLLLIDDIYVFRFTFDNDVTLEDYIIRVYLDDKVYTYTLFDDIKQITLNLTNVLYQKEDREYSISNFNYGKGIEIHNNNVGIYIEYETNYMDTDIIEVLDNLTFDESLEEIYNRINNYLEDYRTLSITKYNISKYFKKVITDRLYLIGNNLQEFKMTVDNKYIVKKEDNNYVITYLDSDIEDIEKSYFSLNNQINFVKKLERKKK
mgnify:CR=1 FL=1